MKMQHLVWNRSQKVYKEAIVTKLVEGLIVTSAQKFLMLKDIVFPLKPSEGLPISPILN